MKFTVKLQNSAENVQNLPFEKALKPKRLHFDTEKRYVQNEEKRSVLESVYDGHCSYRSMKR